MELHGGCHVHEGKSDGQVQDGLSLFSNQPNVAYLLGLGPLMGFGSVHEGMLPSHVH